MPAVFVNMATVFLGSVLGILFANKISERYMRGIMSALGLLTASIGIMSVTGTKNMLCLIICTVLGTVIGELISIDDKVESLSGNLTQRMFKGKVKGRFAEGFVSASVLFCVGSMTVMGSLEAGINHNYSIIFAKSVLDFFSSMMLASAMGVGVVFSVLFIFVFQGGLTLTAMSVAPYMGSAVITEMSAVGGIILMGMAINLLKLSDNRIKVANMLPGVFLPLLFMPLYNFILTIIG